MSTKNTVTRRAFVKSAALFAGISIVPRHVVAGGGTAPSDKLQLAGIGVGGQGAGDVAGIANGNTVVALCDVDDNRAAETFKKFPDAKKYKDFRKMFDEMEKKIDAVVIATPDHCHTVAAMAALKRKKHVYCEKPLAHNVYEIQELMKAAKESGVVTQLGNQGHSSETIRLFCEWIWDVAIGKVHTIHCGCNAVNSGLGNLGKLKETHPVPPTLDWDQWLGPALQRPYHPAYLPFSWRGWVPFGNGTVGDWICHVVDPVFWALDLGAPSTIEAKVKNWNPRTQGDAYPTGDIITFEFAANNKRGPVKLLWHSGSEKIPRPPELEKDRKDVDTGAAVYGDKGTITYGSHGAGGVRIIPETKMKEYKRPEKKLPRVAGHHQDFVEAIKKGRKAGSDFSYGGPLTELALLGIIAIKLNPMKLQWDGAKMQFANSPEANQLLNPPYREGWKL
ncbi:MAG: Gfo/Idh/MocA family oxidoreductase [Planctomycetota bacterium]|nr:Gfo/Idh/MocA family oxidoreductase [Planctomycetota bacterium]